MPATFFYLFIKQITKSPIKSPNNYKENQYENTNMPERKAQDLLISRVIE
jgi:hypothetical protein